MIGHQAIPVKLEGPPLLQVADGVEEGGIIVLVPEDGRTIVATVDDVVDEALSDGSQGAWHGYYGNQHDVEKAIEVALTLLSGSVSRVAKHPYEKGVTD
jgi:hypothetical protein